MAQSSSSTCGGSRDLGSTTTPYIGQTVETGNAFGDCIRDHISRKIPSEKPMAPCGRSRLVYWKAPSKPPIGRGGSIAHQRCPIPIAGVSFMTFGKVLCIGWTELLLYWIR